MNNVPRCSNCESENQEGGHFCESCGARIESESARAELRFARMDTEDAGPAASMSEGDGTVDSVDIEDAGPDDSTGEPEYTSDSMETDSEGPAETTDAEDEVPARPPKTGYLVFPDYTEQPIPPSQWLIGRADLAKYLPDPEKANEISRGHFTVFQDGGKFFIEDGTTMVQVRPSANKTWLVRGGSRILVTGTGRNELQENDEIDVAELVRLHVVVK